MSMIAAGAFCTPYTIEDNTYVQPGRTNSNQTGNWRDVVGASYDFNVHGIDVIWNSSAITLHLFTNFNNNGYYPFDNDSVHLYLADLALGVGGTYGYGVVLKPHTQWTPINNSPTDPSLGIGLYSVGSWDTSSHFLEGVGSYYYGEKYDDVATYISAPNPRDPMIAIGSGSTQVGAASVQFEPISGASGAQGDPKYKWTVTIDPNDIPGLGSQLDVFWGGALCGNDAIEGTATPVPEPGTLFLLGTGLAGLAGYGKLRFRRKKRA